MEIEKEAKEIQKSNQPPKKRIIIFTRHGERADRRDPDNCENFYDTNLTPNGFKESAKTGGNLGKKFKSLGLIPLLKKLKIVVSPFYRCIQTAKYLRKGLVNYLKQQGYEEEAIIISEKPFYLEDAFMERITKRPVKHVHEMFMYKNKNFLQEKFPEIKFKINSLFDYEKNKGVLKAEKYLGSREELFNCCFSAYIDLFSKVMQEDDDSFILSISHGMYVELLSVFTEDKNVYKKIHYNSTSMLHLKDFRLEEESKGIQKWESEHVFFFKMRRMAEGGFEISTR